MVSGTCSEKLDISKLEKQENFSKLKMDKSWIMI
jgi:hypothetical protein